ncbi:MAG: hypothetical protein M5U01_09985 [Ardenticatenaceae bacterium]|nr:hypothetical protein [Ardenticatenaceae bacterium]
MRKIKAQEIATLRTHTAAHVARLRGLLEYYDRDIRGGAQMKAEMVGELRAYEAVLEALDHGAHLLAPFTVDRPLL